MAAELHPRPPENCRPSSELPPKIILNHILPCLPAKSLLRYKSVSKQWHAFLTSPIFKTLHFHHIINNKHNNPTILLFSKKTNPSKLYSIDYESSQEFILTDFPYIPFVFNVIHVLTSFHGLVCVGLKKNKKDNRYNVIVLWNPLTREYKTLPSKGNYSNECYKIDGSAFCLYYSVRDDDYKLLRINRDIIYLYSLKSNSWRNIGSLMVYFKDVPDYTEEHWWPGVWLNVKHVYFFREVKFKTRPPLCIMLRYNTKTTRFKKIETPHFKKNMLTRVLSFSVVRGCMLHLCVGYYYLDYELRVERLSEIELWKMDGEADGEWTKVVSYSKLSCLSWYEKGPVHVMRHGNWLMHSVFKGNFCEVDLEKSITDITSHSYARGSKLNPDIILRGNYIETFVSPTDG